VTAQNLHRIAGALSQRRRNALISPCRYCGLHQSVGYIESWDLHPKGVCQVHAEQAQRLGYTVHTDVPL
jgi:hypothetical protein